ncbi:hypothetical protein TeGR_g13475 [Tetraparma gracilis]|uniref:Protein ENHANCED DISEASE RESISTANCE 2 C-terminal domain-containing protein n=1 Tax=Tetraparma gracilis TaxID=2962635 RepID=A0ABQ6N0Q8_9STRA|nr:hypothetical protein TeGR_g13475 [Tetraparma gracilis]
MRRSLNKLRSSLSSPTKADEPPPAQPPFTSVARRPSAVAAAADHLDSEPCPCPWLSSQLRPPAPPAPPPPEPGELPTVLVVHWQLPFENGGWGGRAGRGGQVAFWFEATPSFASSPDPAAALLRSWLLLSPSSPELRSRFKAICKLSNAGELGLDYLERYNGKPVLVQKTGRVEGGLLPGGQRYLEMVCDVHGWGMFSKRGLVAVVPKLKDMVLDVGFVIEGRSEDELPERLAGSCCVANLDPKASEEEGEGEVGSNGNGH